MPEQPGASPTRAAHPRRLRRRRIVLRIAFLCSLALAFVGARANAAAPAPFVIELDHQQAIFQLTNLAPGPLGQQCLVVDVRNGTAPSATLSAQVGGTGLADYLDLAIDAGPAAGTTCAGLTGAPVFTGTLTALGAAHGDPSVGLAVPLTDPAGTLVRFTLSLRSDDRAQGLTATLSLRFDAEDTPAPPPPTTTTAPPAPPSTAPPSTPPLPPPSTTVATAAPGADPATTTTTLSPGTTTTTGDAATTTTSGPAVAGSTRSRGPRGETPGNSGSAGPAPATVAVTPHGDATIEVRDPSRAPGGPSVAAQAVEAVTATAAVAAKTSSVPAVFVTFVLGFLAVQDRFDRNDPKLARAPLAPEPELRFEPRPPGWSS